MNSEEMVKSLIGMTICDRKVESVIVLCHPKNNFNPFLIYAICKSGDEFIHLEFREKNRGCGNYAWTCSYPFFIEECLISTYAKNDCYGGWDNGDGTPVWIDESYKK